MGKLKDIAGEKFGMLTAVERVRVAPRKTHWRCLCDCGASRVVAAHHLAAGATRSCGCMQRTRDGRSKSREYAIWRHMISRCHDPRANNFRFYGGKGRFVCEGWRESFDAFLAGVGEAPGPDYTLDRMDTDGDYTCGRCRQCVEGGRPMNCRWATKHVQSRNMRSNRVYEHDGRSMILKDWAAALGMRYLTLHARLERGWPFAKAISVPVRECRRPVRTR